MPGGTVKDCLTAIGISPSALSGAGRLSEEWAQIKKSYFKKVLASHPDKGGDAAVFRDVQNSFEVLRKIFEAGDVKSFATAGEQSTSEMYKGTKEDFKSASTPSWEYYAEAAKEIYATYRLELAKSGRSRCMAQGGKKACTEDPPFIEKGCVRIGFMQTTGSYGRWVHLQCWRIPSKIWLGLPNPEKVRDGKKFEKALLRMNEVSLSGVGELTAAQRKQVVRYAMDKTHWTFGGASEKVRKKSSKPEATAKGRSASDKKTQSTALVVAGKQKESFVIPTPGKGAPKGSLAGQTFTITGVFPEVGGGQGFNLGKDRVKKMITSFGGKVTSSVSSKTDILVVGKDPGSSKVAKARSNPQTRLLSVHDVKVGIQRGSLEGVGAKTMTIQSFNTAFGQGRKLALANTAARKRPAAASGGVSKARRIT
eukprot:TRINITY_DN17028_c0_g3_i1.p1 TRINITY_DN17028_c0_g3~~TRINITY_DN17028_c0_g3_i1.p1  ORF type:complete len:432 (+),score=85.61 TRINITY_DN17028_c0_g3_i1:29-1297(+)